MNRISIGLLILFTSACHLSGGENWARWRGPYANGSSLTAKPPIEWAVDRNVRWRTEIPGKGSSTPIVWDDKVFVLTAIATDRRPVVSENQGEEDSDPFQQFGTGPKPTHYFQYAVICYDRHDGSERWRQIAAEVVPHEAGHLTNTYASSSPVTDGHSLFVSFGSRGIYSYDLAGNLQWKQSLGQMETRRDFGEASSPALHGDTLVVPWDHEGQSFLAALDAGTGEIRWKVNRDEPTTWATPLIVEYLGRHQVITNGTIVRSYDLQTGDLIWSCGGQASNPIPCPVARDGVTYCMTGYRGNAVYAISLGAKGDVTDTDDVLWSRHDAAPYVSSAVMYDGRIYFTKSRSSILSVLDATSGEPLIDQHRLRAMQSLYASPVAADGRVYFCSREGTTVVISAGGEGEPTVLAVNELGETIDASPAIVDHEIFIRAAKHLFCISSADH